ncbi:GHMP kinase [candidate division KSB1 bacterium]|nr:MAG: GHMP kinase [candidate division KSB1 bacterium]
MCIKSYAYARAGLLGNPSDVYNGKTISISVRNFYACVILLQTPEFKIESGIQDLEVYNSVSELIKQINLYGYYGGVRLIKSAIKTFFNYCDSEGIELEAKNFTISYSSNIPRQVGLGGSSAIVTATIKALKEFYNVEIPVEILPSIILDAELKELGINAGLQDRVIQVFEGCMYMDFNTEVMKNRKYGEYERIDLSNLPPLYIAYKEGLSKVSGNVFNNVRFRFERRDPFIINVLCNIAELAEKGKKAIAERNFDYLYELMNENFELRRKIINIDEGNFELVKIARSCGASAKFAGSGGSIIGIYKDEDMFNRLTKELGKIDANVIKPEIE